MSSTTPPTTTTTSSNCNNKMKLILSQNNQSSTIKNSSWPIYHFKILVPAAAAGRIIGKGGTTIAQLQKDAGARVKMSKASEFYPGTTERVCLISGHIEGILKINDFFMENFLSTSMKILVPNSTAGMIIGKGGSYIKQIKEESGAYVQISQKCTDFSLPERCVTVVGELENIRKACAMILNKIVEDVGSAFRDIRTSSMTTSMTTSMFSQLTTTTSPSSSTSSSSSASFMPTGVISAGGSSSLSSAIAAAGSLPSSSSPVTSSMSNFNHQHPSQSHNLHYDNSCNNNVKSLSPDPLNRPAICLSPPKCNSSVTPFAQTMSPPAPNGNVISPNVTSDMNSAQIIETIKLVLRVSGYGEDAVSEISSAMSTLASYGVLGVGLGLL